MATKNQPITISYTAVTVATQLPLAGDVANHTMRVKVDGVSSAANNTPTDIGNGEYALLLDAEEMNGNFITVEGETSTSGVIIIPVKMTTFQSVTVGPLTAAAVPAQVVSSPIALEGFYASAKTFPVTVNDADGVVVDLSSKTLRFVVQTAAASPTELFSVNSVTVSGSSNEVANIPVSDTDMTQDLDEYEWRLWDIAVPEVLLHGSLKILAALQGTA